MCKCDCGNTTIVSQSNLCRKNKPTRSCGCAVTLDAANAANFVDGTNLGNIKTNKALPNSGTGIRGVYYSKSQGIYVANIGFRGKQYVLKTSKDINVCIAARKEAEKRIYGDFLEWYEKDLKSKHKNQKKRRYGFSKYRRFLYYIKLFSHIFSNSSIPCIIVSVLFKFIFSEHFLIRSDSLLEILKCRLTFLGSSDFIGLPIFFCRYKNNHHSLS